MAPLLLAALASGGGALAKGGFDLIGADAKRDAERAAINKQMAGERSAQAAGDAYYDPMIKAYGADSAPYLSDLAGWRDNAKAPLAQYEQQSSNVDVASNLDPAVAYRQQQATNQINQSAANRGGMFSGSGATGKAIQDRSQAIASDEWGKAYQRGDETRAFNANQYLNKFKSIKDNELETRTRLGDLLKQSGGARENMFDAQGGKADLAMSTERALADLAAGKSRNDGAFGQAAWGTAGNIAGAMGQAGSAAFGKSGGSGGDSDKLQMLLSLLGGK